MGLFDVVFSLFPSVPFLPPAPPSTTRKADKEPNRPLNRFLGAGTRQNQATTGKESASDEKEPKQ